MKAITIFKTPVFLLILVLSVNTFGQTTNTGAMTIMPGTVVSTVEDFVNLETGEVVNDGEFFVYRSFHNNGSIDYVEGGLTRFVGSGQTQLLTGDQPSYFYNTQFNNTTSAVPFQLYSNISVANESKFEEGIVDNDDFGGIFVFGQDGFHTATSDYSHVEGPVHKLGNTDFTYPIGDGGYYRLAGISAPEGNTADFEGKYNLENSNAQYPHESRAGIITEIDNTEYWTIEEISTPSEDVLITLSWNPATTPSAIVSAAEQEQVTIVRWDEADNMWVDEGGAVDVDNQTVTTAVNGYGVFTLGRVNTDEILPCNLVVYNAVTPDGDGVNDYFMIDQSNNECAKNIHVEVYNRWGVKVFETDDYDTSGNVFDGFSSGRLTVDDSKQLPSGTYFYILTYNYDQEGTPHRFKKAGYLYLNGN